MKKEKDFYFILYILRKGGTWKSQDDEELDFSNPAAWCRNPLTLYSYIQRHKLHNQVTPTHTFLLLASQATFGEFFLFALSSFHFKVAFKRKKEKREP